MIMPHLLYEGWVNLFLLSEHVKGHISGCLEVIYPKSDKFHSTLIDAAISLFLSISCSIRPLLLTLPRLFVTVMICSKDGQMLVDIDRQEGQASTELPYQPEPSGCAP